MGQKWKGFVDRLKGDKNSFDYAFGEKKNAFNQQISHGLEDLIHGVVGARASSIPKISSKVKEAKKTARANRIRYANQSKRALATGIYDRETLAFPKSYFDERNKPVQGYDASKLRRKKAGMLSNYGPGEDDGAGGLISDAIDEINKANAITNKAIDKENKLLDKVDWVNTDFPNSIHFRTLPRREQDFREHARVSSAVAGIPQTPLEKAGLPDAVTDIRAAGKWATSDRGLHGSVNIGGTTNETLYDIFLYLPHNLNDSIKVNYTDHEAGMFETLIARLFPGDMSEVAGDRNTDMMEIWGAFKSMFPGSNLVSQSTGNMMNPMKFQALEGIGFRSYSYKFTLRPNNAKEAGEIKKIVQVFKKSSIPGAAGENFRIWTLPNEWSIQFQGPIKEWIDHPLSCVCTGVSVDYGGGGAVGLMEDGSPAAWDLTVEFLETVQLNRQRYVKESAAGPNRLEQAAELGTRIGKAKGTATGKT